MAGPLVSLPFGSPKLDFDYGATVLSGYLKTRRLLSLFSVSVANYMFEKVVYCAAEIAADG
jgi:hypothetical protein